MTAVQQQLMSCEVKASWFPLWGIRGNKREAEKGKEGTAECFCTGFIYFFKFIVQSLGFIQIWGWKKHKSKPKEEAVHKGTIREMDKARKDVGRIFFFFLNGAKQRRCEIKERWEERKEGWRRKWKLKGEKEGRNERPSRNSYRF